MSPYRRISDADVLRRLITIGRSFVEELDPETLLTEILAAAQELTGARFAALGILNEHRTGLSRFITRGIDADAAREIGDLPDGRGILGVLIDDPEPLRLDDLNAHARSFGFPADHPPMTTFLGVPIVVRGNAWGNIYLTEKAGGPFDSADQDALVVLAGWAAVAVNNANLYSEVQRRHDELAHVNSVLESKTLIARAMGSETDLSRVLELIVKRGRALVDASTMAIVLPTGDRLEIVSAAGAGSRELPGTRLPEGTAAHEVFTLGRPQRLPVDRLGIPPEVFRAPAGATAMLVPLRFHGRTLGVLVTLGGATRRTPFSEGEQELMTGFADSAAAAVATAQSVSQHRLRDALRGAEAERGRWARELHDETLQGLAGIRMRLEHLTAAKHDDDAIRLGVRAVSDDVAEEIAKLRSLITELRPAALDELGLRPALESLVRGLAGRASLHVELQIDLGSDRLDRELETAVYRVVQEAMTNVVKHAGASACSVGVVRDDESVAIRVRDDGVGVDEAAMRERAGFGVTGMRERAQLTGGSFVLGPAEDGGTELRVVLPVGGTAPAPALDPAALP